MITFNRFWAYQDLVNRVNIGYLAVFIAALLLVAMVFKFWRPALSSWIPLGFIFCVGLLSFPLAALLACVDSLRAKIGRFNAITWVWLLPLALLIRLPIAALHTLWYDETFTAAIARLPLDQLPTALLGDTHPPLAYVLNGLSVRLFGSSELALRLPSLFFGLVLIGLAHRLALRLTHSQRAANLTALLMTFLPAMIYYSTDARYPMLFTCAVLGAALALLEDRPKLFTVCAASLGWINAIGFLYLGVLLLLALLRDPRRWIVPAALAAFIACLWLPIAFQQIQTVASDSYWLQTLAPIWHVVTMTFGDQLPAGTDILIILTAFALTIATAYRARQWLGRTFAGWVCIGLAGIVPLLAWYLSFVWHPVYMPRTLIPSAVILVIGWAFVMSHALPTAQLTKRLVLASLTLALVGFIASGDRSPDRDIFAHCDGADVVYVSSTNMAIIGMYYAPAPVVVWERANNMAQNLNQVSRAAIGLQAADPNQIPGDICYVLQFSPATLPDEMQHFYTMPVFTRGGDFVVVHESDLLDYYILRWTQ